VKAWLSWSSSRVCFELSDKNAELSYSVGSHFKVYWVNCECVILTLKTAYMCQGSRPRFWHSVNLQPVYDLSAWWNLWLHHTATLIEEDLQSFSFFSSLFVIKLNRVELVNCSHYWRQTLTIWLMWVSDKVLTKLNTYWHKQLQFKCSGKSIFNFLLLCALTGICELCSHLTKSMATCQDASEYSSNRHHSRSHCFVMSILIVDSHLQITARISQCQTLSSQIMLKLRVYTWTTQII
jgi:hypothetical protein